MNRPIYFVVAGLLGLAIVLYLLVLPVSTFELPRRHGPPAVVLHAGTPRLWVLTKQEERRRVMVGVGLRSVGTVRTDTFFHFDLQAYDTRTAQSVWRRRLLTIKDEEAVGSLKTTSRVVGQAARARILGPDADLVWLFVHDRPLAVAAADGEPRITREAIERRNPQLRTLIPEALGFFAFDRGLIIVAADAPRFVVQGPSAVASPYTPTSEDQFQRLVFMADQWSGDHRTADFLVRQIYHEKKWLGLLSEREAADAADDGFGDKLRNITTVFDEGATARRVLWTARVSRTRAVTEGADDRLAELSRYPDSAEFLQGGFLVHAGTRGALIPDTSRGPVVLHRTSLDAQGRLALTLLDARRAEVWRATLPLAELTHRWEWKDRLMFFGTAPTGESAGPRGHHDHIVVVTVKDGAMQALNVTTGISGRGP